MNRSTLILVLLVLAMSLGAKSYVVNRFKDVNGKTIEEITIPGIPEALRKPGPIAIPSRSAVILSDVPKMTWCYGCTATSAAMMAGFYDRNGYPNMYAGPTNGGLFPATNATWGDGECPLSATHQGYDGLATQGHVNRFWTGYGNSGNDPYGTGDPTATYGNCTTDYMGTNQDYWNNSDGSSTIYTYNNGSPLYDHSGNESSSPRKRDAIHGFRLFMESRGYQVSTNYNQKIMGYSGNTLGYTLAQFQQSIDNGIPVMIHIDGHTMVGVGYESTSSTIYIHDTWDYNLHTMTWGGSYSDMAQYAVSVITLASVPLVSNITWNLPSITKTLELNATATQSLIIGNTGTGTLDYECSGPSTESTVLQENFATTSMPTGWIEELVSGTAVSWAFTSGGYGSNPASAHEGAYNAQLYKSSSTASVVKLISPALNLQNAASPSLSFWHAQTTWYGDQDELRVYYRTSAAGDWNLLATYTENVSTWTQRTIALPNPSSTYYIALEGTAKYGYGVCLDEIVVTTQNASSAWLKINGSSSASGSILSGGASQTLSIGFNASGMSAGSYNSTVSILSNSSSNATVSIPVTLNILAALGVPQAPTIVQVEGTTNARLSWNAVSGTISGYRIYFCAEPDFTGSVSLLTTTASNRTYYVDAAAGTRAKGFYKVVAYRN